MTVGIPVPGGKALSEKDFQLASGCPLQVAVLDRWPDGSVRWALLDLQISSVQARDPADTLLIGAPPVQSAQAHAVLTVSTDRGAGQVCVETGAAGFVFRVGDGFPLSAVCAGEVEPLDVGRSGFRVQSGSRLLDFVVSRIDVRASGPLRAEIALGAHERAKRGESGLEVTGRVELFAGMATARIEVTVRNPRRAGHPGGQWPLGDPGSRYIESSSLVLALKEKPAHVRAAVEWGGALEQAALPFEIYQESSGGEHWNRSVHCNRDGVVPMRLRGYRLLAGTAERAGLRASPIVVVDTTKMPVSVAVPQFWERFPQTVRVDAGAIAIEFLPGRFPDRHELQGGEQTTHRCLVSFGDDGVSDVPLAWCHDPMLAYPEAEWCCETGAVPFLIAASRDPNAGFLDLVSLGLDPNVGFLAKRERADEFGWRHFGDLHADHESAFQPPDRQLVSHYNNQYDAIASFAKHFLRTGDARWWSLMHDLARHVRDIDIYHTREDKSAYNGGLFWHTAHYVDAGTATHRTYPRGGKDSGGPAAEHNYNVGLMLHYFLTGERASREDAIGLGQWVIDMDDGRQTVFRWLAGGHTGLASASGSADYHGPGRAAANSILACLVAHRLSGEPRYAEKADELIRRCIHPDDDIEARDLFNVEARWYYTVFLQVLGEYLQIKGERQELDAMFAYARASLLRYAQWVAGHERPYLDRPELLEHPTETWAAQDLRKGDVLLLAALHSSPDVRDDLLRRASRFFEYCGRTLTTMPTTYYTRPLVLVMSNTVRHGWLATGPTLPPVPIVTTAIAGASSRFTPQRARALSRARRALLVVVVVVTAIILELLF